MAVLQKSFRAMLSGVEIASDSEDKNLTVLEIKQPLTHFRFNGCNNSKIRVSIWQHKGRQHVVDNGDLPTSKLAQTPTQIISGILPG